MTQESVARGGRRSTRHHRTDEAFARLLDQDFGLRPFHSLALVGVPKKAAIAVCAWAAENVADSEERGEAVVAWARKRGVGRYDRRLIEAPEITYEANDHERRVGSGQ